MQLLVDEIVLNTVGVNAGLIDWFDWIDLFNWIDWLIGTEVEKNMFIKNIHVCLDKASELILP